MLQCPPWRSAIRSTIVREVGITTGAQVAAIDSRLKISPSIGVGTAIGRPDYSPSLAEFLTAKIGPKEHDRLSPEKGMIDRKLEGLRASSKLLELVEFGMAKPLVSAGKVAKALDVTP